MKIVLINPPHPYLKEPKTQSPSGLMYLAAVLEEAGYHVIIDNLTDAKDDYLISQADLYGISGTVMDIPIINDIIARLKLKGKTIMVGGPCAAASETIQGADSICFGEGEITILKMVKDFLKGNLSNGYQGESIQNLDKIPFPARHLIDYLGGRIFVRDYETKGEQSTVIMTSRGCSHHCAFCSSPGFRGGSRVRFRDIGKVIEEIKFVQDIYNVHQFRFSDDNFTMIPSRAMAMSKLMEPLNIKWRVSARVTPNKPEMWKAMYDAGCREVSFGIESFDQHILNRLNKRATVQQNKDALRNAHEAGLTARCLLMVGCPGQNKDSMRRNIDAINELKEYIASVSCTTFMPLPGSDIWDNPSKYGIKIINKDFTDYNFYLFGPDGRHKMKMVISHNDRIDNDVIQESEEFRNWLITEGIANEG